jgi:hypothetical protein
VWHGNSGVVFFNLKTTIMKKAIVLLAVGFTLTYCNPSQQTGQTSADSSTRATDATTTPGAGTGGSTTDTTSHPGTDSTVH